MVLGKQGDNVLPFSLAGLVEEIGSEDQLTWVLALVLTLSAWIITGNLLLLFRKSGGRIPFLFGVDGNC